MIEGSLLFIVILSTLLFGSVEAWAIAVVGIMIALTFLFFIVRVKSLYIESPVLKKILFAMIVLSVYPVFQLIPLPFSIVTKTCPGIKEIVTLSPDIIPVSHSISIYPFATETGLSHLLAYLMVFSVAVFGIQDEARLYRMLKALAVFGFMVAVFGIIQHAAGNGKIYWFRELTHGGSPFGPFVNRNHFAGFIGMIIPLSLGVGLMSRSIEKKIMYAFFSITMAIALFFSLSRGGIVSFFAGMMVFVFVVFGKTYSMRKLVPVFLFILILASYLLYLGITPIIDRFLQTEVSNEQRLLAWQGVLSAFTDYPFFGSGLGTFQYIFKIYKPEGLYLYWDHAHNDYLELLLEVGIVGAIIIAIFFFLGVKAIVNAPWKGKEVYLNAAFLSSITTIAVHSVVDFNLHIPSNAIVFFLISGIAVCFSKDRNSVAIREE
ncbi:MAG: O-antigen ligase family protein [Nitrospirota bacterium]